MLCSPTPEGQDVGLLRLLAEQIVELGYVESVSHETVRQTLKKRTQAVDQSWVIPPGSKCRLCARWKMYSMFIPVLTTLITRSFVSMRVTSNCWEKRLSHTNATREPQRRLPV